MTDYEKVCGYYGISTDFTEFDMDQIDDVYDIFDYSIEISAVYCIQYIKKCMYVKLGVLIPADDNDLYNVILKDFETDLGIGGHVDLFEIFLPVASCYDLWNNKERFTESIEMLKMGVCRFAMFARDQGYALDLVYSNNDILDELGIINGYKGLNMDCLEQGHDIFDKLNKIDDFYTRNDITIEYFARFIKTVMISEFDVREIDDELFSKICRTGMDDNVDFNTTYWLFLTCFDFYKDRYQSNRDLERMRDGMVNDYNKLLSHYNETWFGKQENK